MRASKYTWGRLIWRALGWLLLIAYPFAVFYGMQSGRWSPRQLSLLLISLVVIRLALRIRDIKKVRASYAEQLMLVIPASLAGLTLLFDEKIWLLLYPAILSAAMFCLFAFSLRYPPTIIESIARLTQPTLDAQGIVYTRRVTWVWCCFFIVNGCIALSTALWGSHKIWVIYNGAISYGLMGMMFLGEWLIRRRVLHRNTSA